MVASPDPALLNPTILYSPISADCELLMVNVNLLGEKLYLDVLLPLISIISFEDDNGVKDHWILEGISLG